MVTFHAYTATSPMGRSFWVSACRTSDHRRTDLGVTLFFENWLALDKKWLKIDLSRLGVNKMTWLEPKQLKNWLDLEQKNTCIHLHYNCFRIMARQKVSINRLSWQSTACKNSSQQCLSGRIRSILMWRTAITGDRSPSQLSTPHWYQFYH